MNEQLKQHLLTEFPEWHQKPLRLSIAEIEAPHEVIKSFFECYSLPQIRICLKELLDDSLHVEGVGAGNHVSTHEDIEKLVEAAWIIHNQPGNGSEAENLEQLQDQSIQASVTISENEEMAGCYEAIHDFFDSFPLPYTRHHLVSVIKAAESGSIWKKADPADLLYFFEGLKTLIDAVFLISKKGYREKQVVLPISPDVPDITQFHLYCGHYDHYLAWDYFPRVLSVKEYDDPYRALEKFTGQFSKKEWKQTLQYILSYALGANSLSELGIEMEILKVSRCLQKMLDACHLIAVRTSGRKKDSDIKETEN